MRRSAAACVLLACASCSGEADTAAAGKTAGKSDCREVVFEGTALTDCVADPARHRIAMALGPADGEPWRGFAAFAAAHPDQASRVAFAVNGGMFDDAGRPIGYYVEDSRRLHRLNRARGPGNFHLMPNGVFFGTDGAWKVRATATFAAEVSQRPGFGTQSGPMLVIDGKLHPRIAPDGESRFVRNAVGIDAEGRAHFVISKAAISFGKLARFYRDRLKVRNALFLDGNVSSLWDPASGRMDTGVPLGPLIVVTKAANAAPESDAT